MDRRSLLTTSLGLLCAPSIVRAGSLMPIFPADPAWMQHQNPVWGELVVRLPNARNLDGFRGIIRPGQFFWRYHGRLIDMCAFERTYAVITSGMIAVNNLDRGVRGPGYHITL
jgi:hypothetical protein